MVTSNQFTPVVPDPVGVALTVVAIVFVLVAGPTMLRLFKWMGKK